MKTETIPLKDLIEKGDGFKNPRQSVDGIAINELAESIASEGLIYPLQVWRTESGNIVVDGRRRLWAIRKLAEKKRSNGLEKEVPCVIIDASTLAEARFKALTGNLQRENLSTFEVAKEMAALKEEGVSGKDIAKRIGKSGAWVSRQLSAYGKATDALKDAWKKRELPDESVQALAKLEPDEQEKRLKDVLVVRDWAKDKVGEAASPDDGKTGKVNKNAAKTKAREMAKSGGDRIVKPSPDNIRSLCNKLSTAPKKDRYLHGIRDALRFSLGEIGYGELDKEFQSFLSLSLESDRPAEEEKEEK